jgi:lysozyme family protein
MEIERTGTSEVSSGGKLTEESYVRTAELAARRAEAEAKLKAASAPWWGKADALVLAVAAGAFGLAANVWVAWYNAGNQIKQERLKAASALELEREKAKSALIVQAVSTDDAEKAQRNVLFFLESGLLPDSDNKIREAAKKYVPVLPSSGSAIAPPRTPPTSPDEYVNYFWSARLRPEYLQAIDASNALIIKAKSRLEKVSRKVGVPWYVIGVLWVRETDGNFDRHLINGDPLSARTVTVPVGRPAVWPPPPGEDAWEFSAVDALNYEQFTNIDISNLGEVLSNLERWNGFGYKARGLLSPYLWSGTDLYERGKYVSDRVFSGQTVASTPGVAALLRRLHDTKVIDLRAGVSGGDSAKR